MGKTKTKNKTSTKGPGLTTASTPATRADNILQALVPKWPALANDDRALFAGKYTDKKCEAMGAGTKSEGVLSDALGWAPAIDKALTAYSPELRRYHGSRFSWYLECLGMLAAERALQQTKGGAAVVLKAVVEQATKTALGTRTEVVDSLTELVEGDDAEEAALSNALGQTDRPDRIVASIGTLCAYAHKWLERPDAPSKKKVEWAGLTLAEVQAAENAAATLAQAAAGKTLEGSVIVRDSPEVNRIEGRVLLEMRAVMRVFNKANARNKRIPKLVPGDATRSALVSRSGKASKADPAANPEAAAPNAAAPADKDTKNNK